MKNLLPILAVTIALFSCKKEEPTPIGYATYPPASTTKDTIGTACFWQDTTGFATTGVMKVDVFVNGDSIKTTTNAFISFPGCYNTSAVLFKGKVGKYSYMLRRTKQTWITKTGTFVIGSDSCTQVKIVI